MPVDFRPQRQDANPLAPGEALLQVRQVSVRFGGVQALTDVSLEVRAGAVTGLIGPNGAGKTTLFNVVTGVVRPTAGEVFWRGESTARLKPHVLPRRGLTRTFQAAAALDTLSVRENVMAGMYPTLSAGLWRSILGTPGARREDREAREVADRLLEHVGLCAIADQATGACTAGQLRLLAVARAAASNPQLIMLDEPAAGLSKAETEQLEAALGRINQEGVALLLVEHDVELVLRMAEHVHVLDFGRTIAEGPPHQVRHDPAVVEAYLGKSVATDNEGRS